MKTLFNRNITKMTPYLISAASIIFAAQFLYHTIRSSLYSPNYLWVIIIALISLLVILGLAHEFWVVKKVKVDKMDYQTNILLNSSIVVILNTMATYFLAIWFNTSTIFAASLICVISTYIFPRFQGEAYSGSVSGMIGVFLSGHWFVALFTGISTAIFYVTFNPYFKGVGGRGGSISYSASILVVRAILNLHPEEKPPIQENLILPSLLIIIATTYITFLLHEKEVFTVVQAAMIVSLVFAVLIPSDYYTLTIAMFTGTIIGMSTSARIFNFRHLLLVSLIAFLLFIPAFHILDGIGGKLGMMSLASFYAINGLKFSLIRFQEFKKHFAPRA